MANMKDLAEAQAARSRKDNTEEAQKQSAEALKASDEAQTKAFAAELKAKGPRAVIEPGDLSVTVYRSEDGSAVKAEVVPVATSVELPPAKVADSKVKIDVKNEATKPLPAGVHVHDEQIKPATKPAVKSSGESYWDAK
jgi:hypothetical protein